MRLIDADKLYDKTTTLEAQALAQCERLMHDEEALEEWKRWSAILAERSAFRCDLEREPTIDAVPVIRCKDCKYQEKEWRKDKRMKREGYWVYGCQIFADLMGYWGCGGHDNEYCFLAERR